MRTEGTAKSVNTGVQMKIYRGPKSKHYTDECYEQVAEVKGTVLRDSVGRNLPFEFNVTKEGKQRQAVCSAHFETEDVAEMVGGLVIRLKAYENTMSKLKTTLSNRELSSEQKIYEMKKYLPYYFFPLDIGL